MLFRRKHEACLERPLWYSCSSFVTTQRPTALCSGRWCKPAPETCWQLCRSASCPILSSHDSYDSGFLDQQFCRLKSTLVSTSYDLCLVRECSSMDQFFLCIPRTRFASVMSQSLGLLEQLSWL